MLYLYLLFQFQYLLSEFKEDLIPGEHDLSTAMTVEEMMEEMIDQKLKEKLEEEKEGKEDEEGKEENEEKGEDDARIDQHAVSDRIRPYLNP